MSHINLIIVEAVAVLTAAIAVVHAYSVLLYVVVLGQTAGDDPQRARKW